MINVGNVFEKRIFFFDFIPFSFQLFNQLPLVIYNLNYKNNHLDIHTSVTYVLLVTFVAPNAFSMGNLPSKT